MAETPSELCTRSEELLIRIRSAIRPGLDELLQKEIAELVNLVPDFELLDSLDLLRQAEVAAEALLADPPNIAIATEIRKIFLTAKNQDAIHWLKWHEASGRELLQPVL